MATLIKITTLDADYILVEFNDAANRWDSIKLRRNSGRAVGLLAADGGVEIRFIDGSVFQLHYQFVDDVDGDTNITSNQILYNKLINLM